MRKKLCVLKWRTLQDTVANQQGAKDYINIKQTTVIGKGDIKYS